MTSTPNPLVQQVLTDVQALADGDASALQAVQDQLHQVQIQLAQTSADDTTKGQALAAAQAQNAALVQQVATLTAQLAALQPKPAGPDIGLSMNTLSKAEADSLHASTGVTHFRAYIPPSMTPEAALVALAWLPGSGYTLDLSIHSVSGVPQKSGETDQAWRERGCDLFSAGQHPHQVGFVQLAALGGVTRFVLNHEPDQKNRVRPEHYGPASKKMRQMMNDAKVTAEFWMVLTGTTPARFAQWYPGPGVFHGAAGDNYSNSANVAAVLKPFADAITALDPAMKWGVFEYGPFKNQTKPNQALPMTATLTKPIVAAFTGPDVLALNPAALDWYDINLDAGWRIDNDPTLAPLLMSHAVT